MDPELLKLIQQAVEKGLTSTTWAVMLLGLIGAGIGAFLGSYLKKSAELLATKKEFDESLRQLEAQTKATEKIKGEMTAELDKLRTDLQVLAHKRETRFSEWHSRQVVILIELYRRLFRAEEALRPTLPDLQAANSETSRERREELRTYFEENKVFIPDQIKGGVDYLLMRLSQLHLRTSRGDIGHEEAEIMDVAGNEIPQLLRRIGEEIKAVVNGESDGLSEEKK